jgi:DNA mismatch repair protein MutS2
MSGRVRAQIEEVMRDEAYAPLLQDRFWTIRGDRYVLPLRASAKSMGLGILHDTSRTGETVFVEPASVVALNNRLKLAELEIEREIRRILEELSAEVALAAPLLRANLAVLIELDVIAAKARLAAAYGGAKPELVDQEGADPVGADEEGAGDRDPQAAADGAILDLRQAAHPILLLRQSHGRAGVVVRNDITLGGERRVLVISGPNAGGKTVLLKTAGLAALMVRAGMLLPAAPQSRIGFFHGVFAEIGDQQSVVGDLSTFSAHLANVAAILRQTESLGPGRRSLVLLDELMAGTNPDQGAALARATL